MDAPGEKLVIKLWETVAEKGIGSLFKPWQLRREGRASIDIKREELLIIAQAELDADRIRRGEIILKPSRSSFALLEGDQGTKPLPRYNQEALLAESNATLLADTIRREVNVTRILLRAEQSLEGDQKDPAEGKVDDDWLYKWRDSASDVSNEELQELWARLLAGEIKTPGSVSLRTIDFLRNISKEEAQDIAKLSRFVIGDVVYRDSAALLAREGLNLGFLLRMQDIGVISGVEALILHTTWKSVDETEFIRPLTSNSMVLIAKDSDPKRTIMLPIYKLTFVGVQVVGLGKFEPHVEYLKEVGKYLKTQGVKVELAKYTDADKDMINCFDTQEL